MNDDLLNQFFLEAFPNPERNGCPNSKVLKALAENSLPPGHPVLRHIVACSECYAEYRHYRLDWEEAQSRASSGTNKLFANETLVTVRPLSKKRTLPVSQWAIAAGLLVLLGGGTFIAFEHHSSSPAPSLVASSAIPIRIDVDLYDAVTTRGVSDDTTPLQQVSLPSSMVDLDVTLPRFSESGTYQVLVSKDRAGQSVVARGVGQATVTDKKVRLAVNLDLRGAAPGTYFLATVRGSDNGTYYYPLKIN